MDLHIHIDGPVTYTEPEDKTYMLPLGPCQARVGSDDVLITWHTARGPACTALSRMAFEAHQSARSIVAVRPL